MAGIEHESLALQADSLPPEPPGKPQMLLPALNSICIRVIPQKACSASES